MNQTRDKLFEALGNAVTSDGTVSDGTGATWSAGVSFKRAVALPQEKYSVFKSLQEAQYYAQSNPVAYPGQIVVVLDEDGTTTAYVLGQTGEVQAIGGAVVLDETTLTTDDDGKVTIRGFSTAAVDMIPAKKMVDGSPQLQWVTIQSVIEGATDTVTTGDGTSIVTTPQGEGYTASLAGIGTATSDQVPFSNGASGLTWKSVYTKSEVDGLVAGTFHFKGNASKLEDGILYDEDDTPIVGNGGDVYQVGDKEYAYKSDPEGTSEWVELGFNIDLSNYMTATAVTGAIATAKQEAINSAKTYTDGQVSSLTSQISGLDTRLDTAESDIDVVEASAAANATAIATLNGNASTEGSVAKAVADAKAEAISTASSDATTKSNAALESAKQYTDEELADVQSGLSEAQTNIGTLQTNLSQAQQDITENESAIAANTGSISSLTTRVGTAEGEIDTLQSDVSAIEASLGSEGNIGTRLSAVEDQADATDATVSTHTSQIAANTSAISAINNSSTGILAQAKTYADTAASNAQSAAVTAAGTAADQKIATALGSYSTTLEMTAAISSAIANADHLSRQIVEEIPSVEEADDNIIYMIKDPSISTGDAYDEYMLINGAVVQTGNTTVDLSDYPTNSQVDAKIAEAIPAALFTSVNTSQFEITENQLKLKSVSTDLLTQGTKTLILTGGNANTD